jgi:hypothetical protein
LAATERELERIVAATTTRARRPLARRSGDRGARGQGARALRDGQALHDRITDQNLRYTRNQAAIAEEEALDGIYVLRTSVPASVLDPTQVVHAYKSLSHVERAFRSYKSVDLQVHPIPHHDPERVRAHVFLSDLLPQPKQYVHSVRDAHSARPKLRSALRHRRLLHAQPPRLPLRHGTGVPRGAWQTVTVHSLRMRNRHRKSIQTERHIVEKALVTVKRPERSAAADL